MPIISAKISDRDKIFLVTLVAIGKYMNRSAALREAIRLLREKEGE